MFGIQDFLILIKANMKRWFLGPFYPASAAEKMLGEPRKTDRTLKEEILYFLLESYWYDSNRHTVEAFTPFEMVNAFIWLVGVLVIPLVAVILTISDFLTRKPLTIDAKNSLVVALKNLANDDQTLFDTFIEALIDGEELLNTASVYQSLNSKELIYDLTIMSKKRKFEHWLKVIETELDPTNKDHILSVQDYFKTFKFATFIKQFPEHDIGDENVTISFLCCEHENPVAPEDRARQIALITDYINNPENNGTRLMQYIHTTYLSYVTQAATNEELTKNDFTEETLEQVKRRINNVDNPEIRCRIHRWLPEVAENATEQQIRTQIQDNMKSSCLGPILIKNLITVKDEKPSDPSKCGTLFSKVEEQQIKCIQSYINDKENDTQLKKYIQACQLIRIREGVLEKKALKEAERLEKHWAPSSQAKAKKIRENKYSEYGLRKALLIHRGFFKRVPDSYTNVFCNTDGDTSLNQQRGPKCLTL